MDQSAPLRPPVATRTLFEDHRLTDTIGCPGSEKGITTSTTSSSSAFPPRSAICCVIIWRRGRSAPRSTTRSRCTFKLASHRSGHKTGDFPRSEAAAHETIALPIYPELSEDQQHYRRRLDSPVPRFPRPPFRIDKGSVSAIRAPTSRAIGLQPLALCLGYEGSPRKAPAL